MRPKTPEPQPFARVLRRAISWFLSCAVIPAFAGAMAVTHHVQEMELNVDGTGDSMEIAEPGDPEIYMVTPTPEPAESPTTAEPAPVAPAPVEAVDPVEPSPTPDIKIELPKLDDVVPKLLGR